MKPLRVGAYAAAAAIALVACSSRDQAADTVASNGAIADSIPSSSSTTPPANASGDLVDAATSAGSVGTATDAVLGRHLTDVRGRTLYMFERDRKDTSACALTDGCARAWPPFGGSTAPSADSSVQSALLGMAVRPDSMRQTSYNGLPVYYYEDDKKPGDTEGQGKLEFGGLWYVVSPSGHPIKTPKQKK
jgi:predicted lipoprotein with Yx(FWY)xxD motif